MPTKCRVWVGGGGGGGQWDLVNHKNRPWCCCISGSEETVSRAQGHWFLRNRLGVLNRKTFYVLLLLRTGISSLIVRFFTILHNEPAAALRFTATTLNADSNRKRLIFLSSSHMLISSICLFTRSKSRREFCLAEWRPADKIRPRDALRIITLAGVPLSVRGNYTYTDFLHPVN